jgi:hypothetical protein
LAFKWEYKAIFAVLISTLKTEATTEMVLCGLANVEVGGYIKYRLWSVELTFCPVISDNGALNRTLVSTGISDNVALVRS